VNVRDPLALAKKAWFGALVLERSIEIDRQEEGTYDGIEKLQR
jgi:hypothetical protein